MSENTKVQTIEVFINASENGVSMKRADGQAWDFPTYLNVPKGLAPTLEAAAQKGADGKATHNIVATLPKSAFVRGAVKSGPNAGTPKFTVTITEDEVEDFLNTIIKVVPRKTVSKSVIEAGQNWLAKMGIAPVPTADVLDDGAPF